MEGKIRTIDIRQPFQTVKCEKCNGHVLVRTGTKTTHTCSK
jgi:hypothetical protein